LPLIDVGLDQFIPRGSKVANSGKLYLLVLYTGAETKIIQNQGTYKFKKSFSERVVNIYLAWNVFLTLVPIGLSLAYGSYRFAA
jgi:magnesium-transporting ATPase (P-type)